MLDYANHAVLQGQLHCFRVYLFLKKFTQRGWKKKLCPTGAKVVVGCNRLQGKQVPEWHLVPPATEAIFEVWGILDIDLFAFSETTVVEAYISLDSNESSGQAHFRKEPAEDSC
ncbi:unnamed protein product, partial [Brenthis ino]